MLGFSDLSVTAENRGQRKREGTRQTETVSEERGTFVLSVRLRRHSDLSRKNGQRRRDRGRGRKGNSNDIYIYMLCECSNNMASNGMEAECCRWITDSVCHLALKYPPHFFSLREVELKYSRLLHFFNSCKWSLHVVYNLSSSDCMVDLSPSIAAKRHLRVIRRAIISQNSFIRQKEASFHAPSVLCLIISKHLHREMTGRNGYRQPRKTK